MNLMVTTYWRSFRILVGALVLFAAGSPPVHSQTASAPTADPLASLRRAAEDDPNLRALLVPLPETAEELAKSIGLLIGQGRPDLAKPWMDQLAGLRLSDADLAALVSRVGAGSLVKLSLARELQPAGREFAARALNAADTANRAPGRVAKLVQLLTDDSLDIRRGALKQLRTTGNDGVLVVANALLEATDIDTRRSLVAALAGLGHEASDVAIAFLENKDPIIRAAGCFVLERTGADDELLLLLAPALLDASPAVRLAAQSACRKRFHAVPDAVTAIEKLSRAAEELRRRHDRERLLMVEENSSEGSQWSWDASGQRLTIAPTTASRADISLASRLALDAYRLSGDQNAQNAYLALAWETADSYAWPGGETYTFADVEDVLTTAREKRLAGAAVKAARLLGSLGDKEIVRSAGGSPAPIVLALRDTDPRVRFAALEAIQHVAADTTFAGASHVRDALEYFAAGRGRAAAIVITGDLERGQNLVAWLAESGFGAEVTATARDALSSIWSGPDVELIVLDAAIAASDAGRVITELRHDFRSRVIPVMVLAEPDALPYAGRFVGMHAKIELFPIPADRDIFQTQLDRFLEEQGRSPISPEGRLSNAQKAQRWLAESTSTSALPGRDGYRELSRL